MTTLANRGLLTLLTNGVSGVTFRAGLLTAAIADATVRDWNTVLDITNELTTAEVSNYARITLTNVTLTEDDTGDRVVMDSDDLAFGSLATQASGTNPRMVVVFKRVGASDATTDPIIGVFAYGDQTTGSPTNGAAYTVQTPADGLAVFTHV